MKKLLQIALGIVAAVGGFVDIGELVFNTQAGADFRFRLLWAVVVGVIGIVVFAEMTGRVAAIAGRPVFDVVRMRMGFTVGLITWWESEAAAYRFARGEVHVRFWIWGADPRHSTGGWLAHYRYERGGALWGDGVPSMMRRLGRHTGPAPGGPARLPGGRRR